MKSILKITLFYPSEDCFLGLHSLENKINYLKVDLNSENSYSFNIYANSSNKN